MRVCVCVCVVYILTSDDECEFHSFIANGIGSETLVQCTICTQGRVHNRVAESRLCGVRN